MTRIFFDIALVIVGIFIENRRPLVAGKLAALWAKAKAKL